MGTWKKIYSDRYKIIKKIKTGGFGITYLVEDKKGQTFVLKTLTDDILTNPEHSEYRDKYLQDCEKEAAKLGFCRHPHIVAIENKFSVDYRIKIDNFSWSGALPCIVMEYIAGKNLWDLVREQGALPEAEALLYIRQIGDALILVHEKGLLHRDIKPQNIMKRYEKSEAVLIDFGIAREFMRDVTQIMTPHLSSGFAPVEQYDEIEHRGEWTDVYGLSATLYYLLTKKVPPIATMRGSRDKIIPLNNLVSVEDRVHEAVMAGLQVLPEKRPQSVEEWLDMFPIPVTIASPAIQEIVPAKYEKLQQLLVAGEWKAADQETARVMLQVAGREEEGWLGYDNIKNFPCEDLRTIDQLWVKYSNGRFGFSVQKNIWLECGGTVNYATECKLGDRIGWRVKGEWIRYNNGTFNIKALPGHLPRVVVCWAEVEVGGWWFEGDCVLCVFMWFLFSH